MQGELNASVVLQQRVEGKGLQGLYTFEEGQLSEYQAVQDVGLELRHQLAGGPHSTWEGGRERSR